MRAFPPIVSLKLGSQSLGLARFEVRPNRELVLSGFCLRELLFDPATETDPARLIEELLPTMMREVEVKPGPAVCAVSGRSIFTRFVRLPIVAEEKIERIIRFEAQQNVPFPIGEVTWDYQLVGSDADGRPEVVLVAIKTDLLARINGAVENAGLQTTLVDVAALSLSNAFRFNYRDLDGCSLVIDIGARTTNLLFVEAGKVFTRTLPIGGSSITAAIAKEFGESFAAAELRKRHEGFVSLGASASEASNPDGVRLSGVVRGTMIRIHAEVARSISFYCAQQEGSQPERAFLCGGGIAPCIREFFQEKLPWPIEFLNPLRNITVAPSLPREGVSGSAHLLGELVGLALRGTPGCRMELNLRPPSVVRRQDLAQRRPFLLLGAVCFILGLLSWGFYFDRSARVQTEFAGALQVEIDQMRPIEDQLNRLRRKTAKLDETATPLLAAVSDRGAWVRIIDDLNARLPKEDIWITELVPTSGSKLVEEPPRAATHGAGHEAPVLDDRTMKKESLIDGVFIRGLYLSNPKQQEIVVDYFRNLLSSAVFEVKANQQTEVIRPSTPTAMEWAYPYELRLKLRRPLALR